MIFWLGLVCVIAAGGLALALSFAANTLLLWLSLAGVYVVLGGLSLWRLRARAALGSMLVPRWGDLSIGAITGLLLLLGSWAVRSHLLPTGSARLGWLGQVYRSLGDPREVRQSLTLSLLVVLVSVLEEVVWRGYVQQELGTRLSQARASMLSTVLYACVTTPAVLMLADPVAGPNPLPALAALGCGLVWAATRAIVGRLPPVMVSHALFTYFTVTQVHWPGLG
ncbi:MAG: CPBP family intramembrane metalloprotease [Polyangiaceae bacterium]|nr:CPBP family intramembrane metalloprotease [Polyangiaceae bacterium]